MDTRILEEIGLTSSEIKVYLALLELGSTTKGPLVKKAGITSSKVYEVVDKLIEKGLASYVTKNNVRFFGAAPPSRIRDYLQEKEAKIKEQEETLASLLPQLELTQKLRKRETDAEVYRGWRGMQTVYASLLTELNRGDSFYVFGASKGTDVKKIQSFFTRFNQKMAQKGLRGHIIFNRNAKGNIPHVEKHAMVRYLDQTTPAEILVYKDKTAIVLLEQEPLVIMITGAAIATSFKAYFHVMWMIAKKK